MSQNSNYFIEYFDGIINKEIIEKQYPAIINDLLKTSPGYTKENKAYTEFNRTFTELSSKSTTTRVRKAVLKKQLFLKEKELHKILFKEYIRRLLSNYGHSIEINEIFVEKMESISLKPDPPDERKTEKC